MAKRVAVLGAGLQGACVAIALAERGVSVDVYDREAEPLTQASAQNEGKIHLGYVYANDSTRATARLMVEGALSFAPLLRRWIGPAFDRVPVSSPFLYAVHRTSLLSPDAIFAHLKATHALLVERGERRVDYLGRDALEPPCRLPSVAPGLSPDTIAAAFRTPELAIDPDALARVVRGRLRADPAIRLAMRTPVTGVDRTNGGAGVRFVVDGRPCHREYDHVVNALWDGRLAIDATAGLRPDRPWLFRVKHYLRVPAGDGTSRVPSVTIVLGPYGDTVAYENGALYLSWYPVGMSGMSNGTQVPDWPRTLDAGEVERLRRGIWRGLAGVIPAVSRLTPAQVGNGEVQGGVIFAWGRTDIDDPVSGLHARSAIGPRSWGRYHSIDTGKLTVAPLFAERMAGRIANGSTA